MQPGERTFIVLVPDNPDGSHNRKVANYFLTRAIGHRIWHRLAYLPGCTIYFITSTIHDTTALDVRSFVLAAPWDANRITEIIVYIQEQDKYDVTVLKVT